MRPQSRTAPTPGQSRGSGHVHIDPPEPLDWAEIAESDHAAEHIEEPARPADPPALRTALAELEAGRWPVAVYPYDAKVPNPGKAPIGTAWGQTKPTAESLQATWKRYPKANVGLKLGAEGDVVDIDVDDPEQAGEVLARIFPDDIPKTRGWINAEGRYHLLFRWDDRLARYGKSIIKGVLDRNTGEVRGNPSYLGLEIRIGAASGETKQLQTVIPPSLMANGEGRRWNEHTEILPVPECLIADLDAHAVEERRAMPSKPERPKLAPATARDAYVRKALDTELSRAATAPEGTRNEQLNRSAFALGQLVGAGVLDRSEAEQGLLQAAFQAGLGEIESRKTIGSGLNAGISGPRDLSSVGQKNGHHLPGINGEAEKNDTNFGNGVPPTPNTLHGDDPGPNEAIDDPHRLARIYLAEKCSHEDGLTIRYHQGEFLKWAGAWRAVSDKEVNAEVNATIKTEFDRLNILALRSYPRPANEQGISKEPKNKENAPPVARKVTRAIVGNVGQALGSYSLLSGDVRHPAWLSEEVPFPADEVLPTHNAIVHLPSLVAGRPAIRKPTPLFFAPYVLDYDFDSAAPAPAEWLRFLSQIWPDDPESISSLQEWFGYLLLPDTRQQKIAMLIGPKRSGKGTIGRVVQALIGPENVANPTLSSLTTNFGLAPLIGKLAAIIGDARLSGRTDVAQVVERLLSISGEDSQTLDRKHLPSWTGKLPVRFMVISNELPRFTDASGALAGRMVILSLTRSFYGQEDKGLFGRLLPELPGILLWAIEGWRRLNERGSFVQPKAGLPLVEEMEDLSNPVGMFLKERCRQGIECEVKVPDLFLAWQDWCKSKNRDRVGDESSFGRSLRTVIPDLVTKPVKEAGKYYRVFKGVQLESPF